MGICFPDAEEQDLHSLYLDIPKKVSRVRLSKRGIGERMIKEPSSSSYETIRGGKLCLKRKKQI